MGRYAADASALLGGAGAAKAAKARGQDLRTSYKNMRECCAAVAGMELGKAKRYLQAVLDRTRCIPFRRHTGCIGRTAQAKNENTTTRQGRWPVKSVEALMGLLVNAEANAESKGLDTSALRIAHVQAQRAPGMRRRTYRAHGRINPYASQPCHVELVLAERAAPVAAAEGQKRKLTSRQAAKALRSGAKSTAA
jgi:large subunit ribosomal protein L17e